MSEKAITIGLYAVASGIFTVFMPVPHVAGSRVVRQYLEHDVERETGGRFLFTDDIEEAARAIVERPRSASGRRSSSRPMMYGEGATPDAVAAAQSGRLRAAARSPRPRLRPRPDRAARRDPRTE